MSDEKDIVNSGDEDLLTSQAKTLFEESVQNLDAATRSRLTQGRHQALAELTSAGAGGSWKEWRPVAGIAAATVIAVVLWRGEPQMDELIPPAAASDFEILLDQEEFEMLQDLEFYSWIDFDDDPGANVG